MNFRFTRSCEESSLETRDQREFRAHPSALADVRRWVRAIASHRDLSQSLTEELVIAVNEACTNSVLHSTAHAVEIVWKEDADLVEVEIRDGGVFRPPVMVGPDEETGRGIPVMLAASDEFTMKKGTKDHPGTVVRIRKRKSRSPEARRAST